MSGTSGTASVRRTLAILAVTQIVSWGSLYYAFAVLAAPLGRALGLDGAALFGPASWSLLVAGLAAAPAGALIDRLGGRAVMAGGSLLAAAGLLCMSVAAGLASYLLAWTLIGLAMAATLYEAAFAAIARLHGEQARGTISSLTLFGGFASTLFWPLSLALGEALGWRATYAAFAGLHLLVCLPLHLGLAMPQSRHAKAPPAGASLGAALRQRRFWLLAGAFCAGALVSSALSVHLIGLLVGLGHPAAVAVALAALIGPLQVAGRLAERLLGAQYAARQVGAIAFASLPAALLILALWGRQAWAAAVFCMLYGAANGVLTIVRATIPLELFGRAHYGAVAGAMAGPALLARAGGPLAAGWALAAQASAAALPFGLCALTVLALGLFVLASTTPGGILRPRQTGPTPQ